MGRETINHAVSITVHTLCSDCQWLTLTPLLTPTVDTTYCDVVLITCHKTSQYMLCNTGSGDVQKSPIWGLGNISGDVDEVEINPASTTQCPAHSDLHGSISIFSEVNTRKGGYRGGTWRTKDMLEAFGFYTQWTEECKNTHHNLDHTYSLGLIKSQDPQTRECSYKLKTTYNDSNEAPFKVKGQFLCPVCARKERRMAHLVLVLAKVFLQSAIQQQPHVTRWHPPTHLHHPMQYRLHHLIMCRQICMTTEVVISSGTQESHGPTPWVFIACFIFQAAKNYELYFIQSL